MLIMVFVCSAAFANLILCSPIYSNSEVLDSYPVFEALKVIRTRSHCPRYRNVKHLRLDIPWSASLALFHSMKGRHMNNSLAMLGTSERPLVVPRLPNVRLTRLPANKHPLMPVSSRH